jgi:hypothetical protein
MDALWCNVSQQTTYPVAANLCTHATRGCLSRVSTAESGGDKTATTDELSVPKMASSLESEEGRGPIEAYVRVRCSRALMRSSSALRSHNWWGTGAANQIRVLRDQDDLAAGVPLLELCICVADLLERVRRRDRDLDFPGRD